MTEFTPKLEKLIREIGDYSETQMKDLLNPKAHPAASALRIAFRAVVDGEPLMKQAFTEAGWGYQQNWIPNLQKLVDIAEQNGSNAADQIKKSLPIATTLTAEYKDSVSGILNQVKIAKQKNIQY
ncbi:MAG: hypothetical protein WC269_06355 [Candidatus Gracilibacteria bacterium]|jgi:hypothetical protein